MKDWVEKNWLIIALILGITAGPPIGYGLFYLVTYKNRLMEKETEAVWKEYKKSNDEFLKLSDDLSKEISKLGREFSDLDLDDGELFKEYEMRLSPLLEIIDSLYPVSKRLSETDQLIQAALEESKLQYLEDAKQLIKRVNEILKDARKKLDKYKKSAFICGLFISNSAPASY